MFEVDWNINSGWNKPKIVPYHNLVLSPNATSLHYAIECFEGLKAYSSITKDEHYLFRPELNAKRMNSSAFRMCLPTFIEEELIKGVAELVNLEKEWIPKMKGYSLYIRPTLISTTSILGVSPPTDAKLYIVVMPVGPYYQKGFKPIKLLASDLFIRSFPGGSGAFKVGCNYAPTIMPHSQAFKKMDLIKFYG